jgi:hypothetical protein
MAGGKVRYGVRLDFGTEVVAREVSALDGADAIQKALSAEVLARRMALSPMPGGVLQAEAFEL